MHLVCLRISARMYFIFNLKITSEVVMSNFNNNSIIYIACPAKAQSGGPELLHQLGNKLISKNINCKMYYYNDFIGDPVPNIYKEYNVEYETQIVDDINSTFAF
jgi:hypothetical protein